MEFGVRSAAILSFVGIQGLGYQIQLAMDDLFYYQVWTLMYFMVAVIVAIDVWSSVVRRNLTITVHDLTLDFQKVAKPGISVPWCRSWDLSV